MNFSKGDRHIAIRSGASVTGAGLHDRRPYDYGDSSVCRARVAIPRPLANDGRLQFVGVDDRVDEL
jgi:hypothetical protein